MKANRILYLSVCCLMILVILAVSLGCAKKATPTPAGTATPKQEVFKWKMQTQWTSAMPLHKYSAVDFADRLRKVTGGRFDITVYSSGGIVGAMEVLDAVSKGTVECSSSAAVYWSGKDSAAPLFCTYPMGLTTEKFIMWLYYGGGLELEQEMYDKHGYNVKVFINLVAGVEIGGMSLKPIRSLADLKGKKMRITGPGADILSKLGVSIVTTPGAEVYSALERGVVDITEWSTPSETWPLGIHEVAKYMFMPGFHQPASVLDYLVNKDAWEKLPDDLKAAFESCAKEACLMGTYKSEYENAYALRKFQEYGVEIIRLPKEDLDKLKAMSKEWADEMAAKDPFFAKVLASQRKFLSDYKEWEEVKSFD